MTVARVALVTPRASNVLIAVGVDLGKCATSTEVDWWEIRPHLEQWATVGRMNLS